MKNKNVTKSYYIAMAVVHKHNAWFAFLKALFFMLVSKKTFNCIEDSFEEFFNFRNNQCKE